MSDPAGDELGGGSSEFVAPVAASEEALSRLLKSWRSRYCHIILLKHADRRVVQFETQWARRPTPMEPVPSLRILVHFSFLYDAKAWARQGHTGPPPPQVSYRLEHERTVYSGPTVLKSNIDHHILRLLKAKHEFARGNPLPLTADQSEFFHSRATYEPLARVADSHLGSFAASFASDASVDLASASTVEKELISMFQRADYDQNGSLDPEEFEELLLNSKWGFTKEDVQVVMKAHDANDDGALVYSEFIPIAIDLVQAQRASAYAQTMTTASTDAAYRAALARIQGSRELHRAMDSGLGRCDPADTGSVRTGELIDLLRELDIDLTDGEIGAILARVRAINKAAEANGGAGGGGGAAATAGVSGSATPSVGGGGAGGANAPINIRHLQDNYEDILLQSIQRYHLDQEASDVEIYLNALFRKLDTNNTGLLSEKAITSVLSSNPAGVSLSSTQIYAIMGSHAPSSTDSRGGADHQGGATGDEGNLFKYRLFARKAAHMILMLFEPDALRERSSMIKRSAITPIQLLGAKARARIERAMRAKMREFDADSDGRLSEREFAACMADTGLLLSGTEVAALRARADTNADGFVDLDEFVVFAYETLLHLQRDAALKAQMSAALRQKAAEASKTNGAGGAQQ